MGTLAQSFHGVFGMMLHGLMAPPIWLALAGAGTAWYLYIARPDLPAKIKRALALPAAILERKYGFDEFNDWFFAGGARMLGGRLWRWGDVTAIDGWLVNGSARMVGKVAAVVRHVQTGYIYHYAFAMIIGVALMAIWFV